MRITLCGSTRFRKEFEEWNAKLTLAGHTVYSVATFGREASDVGKSDDQPLYTEEQKVLLDLVHLDKILNSQAVVVINPGGYVGFSTRREIQWAKMQGRSLFYLEPIKYLGQMGIGSLFYDGI